MRLREIMSVGVATVSPEEPLTSTSGARYVLPDPGSMIALSAR
jgi:hypothetical protein